MVPVGIPALDATHTAMPARNRAVPRHVPLPVAHARQIEIRVLHAKRRRSMNWDQIAGNWKQFKGKVKEKWGDLNDDDLTYIDGKRDQLIGRVQERYGIAKDEAERQVKAWERMH
jgi:uncharacterized protein YjbJ (UPF0337 family)